MSEDIGPNICDRVAPPRVNGAWHLLMSVHARIWRDKGWSFKQRVEACDAVWKLIALNEWKAKLDKPDFHPLTFGLKKSLTRF